MSSSMTDYPYPYKGAVSTTVANRSKPLLEPKHFLYACKCICPSKTNGMSVELIERMDDDIAKVKKEFTSPALHALSLQYPTTHRGLDTDPSTTKIGRLR